MVSGDRTRDSGHKLKYRNPHLKIRKGVFSVMGVVPWKRLPRKVVEFPSLEIFKTELDMILSSLL